MKRLLVALIFVMLPAPAYAQDIQSGLAALERGDYAAALREWRPLAEQGDATAQFNLGTMYHLGRGVSRDYAKAVRWYRLAVEKGEPRAQINLGRLYAIGYGVPQDFIRAHMWFDLAAALGLKRAVESRDMVVRLMTSAQIAEAQRMARDWLKQHRNQPVINFRFGS